MASSAKLGLVMVLVSLLCAKSMAQSGCTSVLISLSPCLNFVSGSSSTPSSSCCSQLSSVVKSQPRCLCMIVNGGGSSLGVSINQTLALALPGACNVQTPPPSACNAGGGSVMAPAGAPEGAPGDDTTSISTVSGGSKTSTSNGDFIKMPLPLILFLLFVASRASTFKAI